MDRRKRLGIVRIAGLAGLVIAAAAAAFTLWLAFPMAPSSAQSLHYRGYTLLPGGPRGGLVTVLDYLTVEGQDLFVAGESSGTIYKLALNGPDPSMPVTRFAPGPALHGVAFDPVSHMAFASRSDANTVEVFDPAAMAGVKSIPTPDDPDGVFFIPFAGLVYLVNGDAGQATLIDPASRTVVGTIPLGGKPEFAAVDPARRLVYQNLEDLGAVAVVDVAARKVVERMTVTGCAKPTGLAFDAAARRLFIACSGNSVLTVFDPDNRRFVADLKIGAHPDSVAYDPGLHRIYTTGRSGVMSVIQQTDPDAYRTLDTVRLHYGAHTLAVDPSTHRLYVGYASFLTRARIAVFDAVP